MSIRLLRSTLLILLLWANVVVPIIRFVPTAASTTWETGTTQYVHRVAWRLRTAASPALCPRLADSERNAPSRSRRSSVIDLSRPVSAPRPVTFGGFQMVRSQFLSVAPLRC